MSTSNIFVIKKMCKKLKTKRWRELAKRYIECRENFEISKVEIEEARKALIEESNGNNVGGFGVYLVYKCYKGKVDLEKIKDILGEDLDEYRQESISTPYVYVQF